MLPFWLVAVLVALATHRVTRLITRDQIPLVAAPREAFVQRWGGFADAKTREDRKRSINGNTTNVLMRSLAYLWECDWCASVWVAGGISYATYTWSGETWWHFVLLGLAASSVTGLIAQREPD